MAKTYHLSERDIAALSAILCTDFHIIKKLNACNLLNAAECRNMLIQDHWSKLGYMHVHLTSQQKLSMMATIFGLSEDYIKHVVYNSRKTYNCRSCGTEIKTKASYVRNKGFCIKCVKFNCYDKQQSL